MQAFLEEYLVASGGAYGGRGWDNHSGYKYHGRGGGEIEDICCSHCHPCVL